MISPSYFVKVAAVSHGRVLWQTHRTYFVMGASLLAKTFGVGFIDWLGDWYCLVSVILVRFGWLMFLAGMVRNIREKPQEQTTKRKPHSEVKRNRVKK